MATTFATTTTSNNNTTTSSGEIRASISINRVPLISAQTTNCEQAISAKQQYFDQSIHTSTLKQEKKQLSSSKITAEQSINRLDNRSPIDSSIKTATSLATTRVQFSSSNNDERLNFSSSQMKSNHAQNSSQLHRSSNCQVDKSKTNSINQSSAIIRITSSCASKSVPSSSSSASSISPAASTAACSGQIRNLKSQSQDQSYHLQYQEEFYKMRERLFRMLSKVPIKVETEPSLSWQQHLERSNRSPVHQTGSASTQNSSASTSTSTSSASSSSISSSSRSISSRKIDQEALIIKYYNDKSLNDILEQHFGCALINHNFVLGLALDSQHQDQHQQQNQRLPAQQTSQNLDNLGNVDNFSFEQHQHQSTYCMASDNEMCRGSLQQHNHHALQVEQCIDWQSQNSYNMSWQMAQHDNFELINPSSAQPHRTTTTTQVKKPTNQKRSTINTVKDYNKYAPNNNQNQRQQAKRQRLSNPARQHPNIAPVSIMPMNTVRPINEQVQDERALNTTSNGRILPLSLVEYQQIPASKKAFKEMEDQRDQHQHPHPHPHHHHNLNLQQQQQLQEEQLLLVRQIHGKPTKYLSGTSGASPRLDSDQHLVFDNNFIVSRPLALHSQVSLSNQEARSNGSEHNNLGQYSQHPEQQLLNHNHLNNHGQLQELHNELHTLYHPPSYLQPRSEDQITVLNCFEPNQSNLDHQLNQRFEQREPNSCYGTSPQLADQQQQFLTDHSSYYHQAQTSYLNVEPQAEWQCHSQHAQPHLSHPLQLPLSHHHHQHQQEPPGTMSDIISSHQQHVIDQQHQEQQSSDGLLSESYSVMRHNFVSQNSPYQLAEPTYSLVYQPDCNTAQLNINLTTNNNSNNNNNNPGQQLLLIDETSQHLNHSVGQVSQLIN